MPKKNKLTTVGDITNQEPVEIEILTMMGDEIEEEIVMPALVTLPITPVIAENPRAIKVKDIRWNANFYYMDTEYRRTATVDDGIRCIPLVTKGNSTFLDGNRSITLPLDTKVLPK